MSTTGAASDYLEALVMKWLGRNTDMPAPPSTVYLALFTGGVPGDDASGATEVSAGNYARLALSTGTHNTGSGSVFSAPSSTNGLLANAANTDFPACASADWGDITGWALYDSSVAGNMLTRGDCPTTTIAIGDIFRFNAAAWTQTFG